MSKICGNCKIKLTTDLMQMRVEPHIFENKTITIHANGFIFKNSGESNVSIDNGLTLLAGEVHNTYIDGHYFNQSFTVTFSEIDKSKNKLEIVTLHKK